jgi:hypothetical protein
MAWPLGLSQKFRVSQALPAGVPPQVAHRGIAESAWLSAAYLKVRYRAGRPAETGIEKLVPVLKSVS